MANRSKASGESMSPPNDCPMKKAMAVIGGKWKLLIIWQLMHRNVARYGELKRGVEGITDMMLSQSLKELEGHGVVERTQYNEIPPKVEYSLTERGKSLLTVLAELSDWGRMQ